MSHRAGNPLIEDGYAAPVYVAPLNVLQAHASALRETNVIVLPGAENPDWQPYWIGLIVAPCILLLTLVCWGFGLCCTPCCRCAYRENEKARRWAFLFFVLCALGSIIAWCFAFSLDSDVEEAMVTLNDSLLQLESLVNGLGKAVVLGDDAVTWLIGNLTVVRNDAVCQLVGISNSIPDEVFQSLESAREPLGEMRQVTPEAQDFLQSVVLVPGDVDDSRRIVLITFASLMLCLVLFFLLSTTIQFVNPGQKSCARFKACMARSSCVAIFTFGILFIALTVLISAVLQALSTVGADVCASPDQTIQRFLSDVSGLPELAASDAFGVDVCTAKPDQKSFVASLSDEALAQAQAFIMAKIVCFYQTCNGDTKIEQVLGKVDEAFVEITETLKNQPDIPNEARNSSCVQALEQVNATLFGPLLSSVDGIISTFKCSNINPIYQAIVHQTTCQEAVATLVKIWKIFFSGALLLLLALSFYVHFHLRLPQDYVFSQEQYKRNFRETGFNDQDADANANCLAYGADGAAVLHSLPTAEELNEPGLGSDGTGEVVAAAPSKAHVASLGGADAELDVTSVEPVAVHDVSFTAKQPESKVTII